MPKTKITGGRLFKSTKASAHQHIVQGREPVRWLPNGEAVEYTKELVAEFAHHGGSFSFYNPLTGTTDTAADIRGHFFDSAAQAEEKGWTQEEHDMVVESLDALCDRSGLVQRVERAKAGKPWPTYDETHHSKIVATAELAGFVPEALQYEQENKNRPAVVEGLRKALEASQEAAAVEDDSLTAA